MDGAVVAEVSTLVSAPGVDPGLHCSHGSLTNKWGWFVQGLLALVSFSALILKRFCEPKSARRPWLIWFYDTSKQGLGALLIHFANVLLSDAFKGDPCTWYIVSFLLDSTLGLVIIYLGLKASQCVFVRMLGWMKFQLGVYGKPPKCSAWLAQCALYLLLMIVEKLCITLVLRFKFWKTVRDFIMSPIKDPKVEVVVVMLIVPVVVNAIMFWIVDNFLMKKRKPTPADLHIQPVRYQRAGTGGGGTGGGEQDSDSDVALISATDDDNDGLQQRHPPSPTAV